MLNNICWNKTQQVKIYSVVWKFIKLSICLLINNSTPREMSTGVHQKAMFSIYNSKKLKTIPMRTSKETDQWNVAYPHDGVHHSAYLVIPCICRSRKGRANLEGRGQNSSSLCGKFWYNGNGLQNWFSKCAPRTPLWTSVSLRAFHRVCEILLSDVHLMESQSFFIYFNENNMSQQTEWRKTYQNSGDFYEGGHWRDLQQL